MGGKRKLRSRQISAGTGALGVDEIFFDLFLLQCIPNGQLTWRNYVPAFAGSPCSGHLAGQVSLAEPLVPGPGLDWQ